MLDFCSLVLPMICIPKISGFLTFLDLPKFLAKIREVKSSLELIFDLMSVQCIKQYPIERSKFSLDMSFNKKICFAYRFPTYDENYLHGDLALLQFNVSIYSK